MTDVTLLVCTRNRAASLDRMLRSITRAATSAEPAIEVVIVDNGSTDDTGSRLAAWRDAQHFPVHLVSEPRSGLARARNTGLGHANGRIVAMTDDDCVLDPGYFTILAQCFARHAAPVVIGGRILLGDPRDLPVTIKLEDHEMIAPVDGFPGGFVMGANLAFTRDVIDRTGMFDARFGAGAPFRAAEDTDLLFRAIGRGIPVRYDPRMTVSHHHNRREPEELRDLLAGYAFGDGALYAKHRADPRIRRAIRRDLAAAWHERRCNERPFASIHRFHAFRLWNLLKGSVAFWSARTPRPSENGIA